jgi:hypothetical protein
MFLTHWGQNVVRTANMSIITDVKAMYKAVIYTTFSTKIHLVLLKYILWYYTLNITANYNKLKDDFRENGLGYTSTCIRYVHKAIFLLSITFGTA